MTGGDRATSDLVRILSAAIPLIGVLVAAAFIVPAGFPWLPRQLILAAIGIGGIAAAERGLFGTRWAETSARLGFVVPRLPSVAVALALCAPMWLFLPAVNLITGAQIRVAPNWVALIIGIVLVNGLTEEVIHRAFIFGRLRSHMRFPAAASIGAVIFALQHVYLIFSLGLVGGVASVVLALLLAFPLCHVFEQGGRSIAGPAILHTSVNASYLVFGDPAGGTLLLWHMIVVLVAIYGSFLLLRPRPRET